MIIKAAGKRRQGQSLDPAACLPRIFNRLAEQDPRRRALTTLADTAEKIGSLRGADLSGSATKGGQSDGGATTRVKHSARLRLIQALANGRDARAAPGARGRGFGGWPPKRQPP